MQKQLSPEEALHRAAALCSAGEQCIFDIREKLLRWGIAPNDSKEIIEKLIQRKFIDEERYCKSFVNDKFRFNKWGKVKIIYALRQKGIPSQSINNAINCIDEEKYLETLQETILSKRKSIKDDTPENVKAKLFRFAASRGFEPEYINLCLKTIR